MFIVAKISMTFIGLPMHANSKHMLPHVWGVYALSLVRNFLVYYVPYSNGRMVCKHIGIKVYYNATVIVFLHQKLDGKP